MRRASIIRSYAVARAAMRCCEFQCCNYIAVAAIYPVLHVAMPLWSLLPSIDCAGLATSLLWPKTGFADVCIASSQTWSAGNQDIFCIKNLVFMEGLK